MATLGFHYRKVDNTGGYQSLPTNADGSFQILVEKQIYQMTLIIGNKQIKQFFQNQNITLIMIGK